MSDESDSFPPMHPSIHGIGRERARKARLEAEAAQPQPGTAAQADTDPDMVAVSRFSFADVLPKEPAQWPQSRTRLLTLIGASGALVLVFALAYFLFATKWQHHGGGSIVTIGHSVTPTATGRQGQPAGVPSVPTGSATPTATTAPMATIQPQATPTTASSAPASTATRQQQATPTPVPPTATPLTCTGTSLVFGSPTAIMEPDGTVLGSITVTLQPKLVSNAHGGCTLSSWEEGSSITLYGGSKVSVYTNGGPCDGTPYSCGLYQHIVENNTRQSSNTTGYNIYGNPAGPLGILGPTLGNLPSSSCATGYASYQDNAGRILGNATSTSCASSN